jgi:hypothetical protein
MYVSQDFFLINYINLKKKISRKKNLEIFGGHLANFFCEVNLEIFLEIFILSYTAVNLENYSIKKSQDFLSLFFVVLVCSFFFLIMTTMLTTTIKISGTAY